jgi:hypothetical protein
LSFQGQAPPSTTGWKVQKPPSVQVLRRRTGASVDAFEGVVEVVG